MAVQPFGRADLLDLIVGAAEAAIYSRRPDDPDVVAVAATIRVARAQGFSAFPRETRFLAYNALWKQRHDAYGGMPTEAMGMLWDEQGAVASSVGWRGAHLYDSTFERTWGRHLVAIVDERWIADPTIETFSRAEGLQLTAARVLEIPEGGDTDHPGIRFPLAEGGELIYHMDPAGKSYKTLHSWNDEALIADVAAEVHQKVGFWQRLRSDAARPPRLGI